MSQPLFGIVVLLANVVTPIVGVSCGYVAQSRYKKRLTAMPEKVAATMPKRFPMADLLICLFMLGPILGVLAVALAPLMWVGSPSIAHFVLWWAILVALLPINLSGPHLIRIGMPPDGTFRLESATTEFQFVGKPAVNYGSLYDAREI